MRGTAILMGLLMGCAVSACSTWEGLSEREKGAAIGAGVGGVAGSAISDGSVLGTVGGAAVGGVVGHEIGKRQED